MSARITKEFAEDLGQSLGGCASELTLGMYYKEAAYRSKARLNVIPFLGMKKKRRFQVLWSCCMEAVAIRCAADRLPELRENQKFYAKTLFQMQTYNNGVLSKAFLPYFSPEELQNFSRIRKDFVRLAEEPGTGKEEFARAFLKVLHADNPGIVDDALVSALSSEIGLATNVFEKMIRIHLEKLDGKTPENA